MWFKNVDGDAFIRCSDDFCSFYRKCLDCMSFIDYGLIYGNNSLERYVDNN